MRELSAEQLLANEVEGVFRQFMFMPNKHAYAVSTLWVFHTHLRRVDGAFLPYVTPRLYFGSKTAGCGKSLATELTVRMSHNGEMVLEPTPPSIVSMMNEDRATLGFDEIDMYFGRGRARETMRAILHGGYKRGSYVTRERDRATEKRNVHGPICLNGKNADVFLESENFAPLRTRSIPIILEPKPAGYQADRFNPEVHEARLLGLMQRLRRWGLANGRRINDIQLDGLMPSEIANRAEEIWAVLFRVAVHLGGEWPARCEAAARAFVLGEWAADDSPCVSPSEELLSSVRAVFGEGEEFLSTATILERLADLPQQPSLMAEWGSERASTMGLSRGLAVFGVEHVRRQVDGVQTWGYVRADLEPELASVVPLVANQ